MTAAIRSYPYMLGLAGAALLTPLAAAAQSNSVLMLLPAEQRLEVGREGRGALSSSDYTSIDGSYLEAWELQGRAGEAVTIDLEASAFDPVLYVAGPGLGETLRDDDGGAGCNSRLSLTFLESGTFRVVASSLGSGQTGTYTLRVSDTPGDVDSYGCGEMNPVELAGLSTDGRSIRLGGMGTGFLGSASATVQDGRPAEAWTLEGRRGDRVSIRLESDDFDAYLYLAGPGLDEIMTDDDGAGDLNSLIEATLPSDGPFTIIAAALRQESSGSYTLTIDEPANPAELPTDGRTLDIGQTAGGYLDTNDPVVADGRRGQAWALDAVAGQRVTIDLESDDFDAYLYVAGPGLFELMSDDDGGEGLDSQITVTFPESGTYRVIASSLSSGTGGYTLSVSSR